MSFEAVIGLEVHAQLKTATKLFCRCPNRFGAAPNTLTCPICLGYPGTLPSLNRRAVDLAVRLALALRADVRRRSSFARKSYFYPDLPKGYQISQLDHPLAVGGRVPLTRQEGAVGVERLHLEEDAGKLLHRSAERREDSLVDFNRCGVPLVEIVSEPEISEPEEAADFLRSLRQIMLYTETSDGNMQEGSLRCDVNVSIRRRGSARLTARTEIKNLNSFRHVARALEFEIERQQRIVASGGSVRRETRTFDAAAGATQPWRGKEAADDYRYFDEPDLPPLEVTGARRQRLAAALPRLPREVGDHFRSAYGLAGDDALLLSSSPALATFFETAVAAYPGNPRAIANWLKTEVLRKLKAIDADIDAAVDPARLARLVRSVDDRRLSATAAKRVLEVMWKDDSPPSEIAERLGLSQVHDPTRTRRWITEVLARNPEQVRQYRQGKTELLGFFIGQAMRRSGGRANPQTVRRLTRQALEPSETPDPHSSRRSS